MSSSIPTIAGIIGGLSAIVVILNALGLDLRIFGTSERNQSKIARPTSSQVVIRKSTLGWLLICVVVSLISSGFAWYEHLHQDKMKFSSTRLDEIRDRVFVGEIVDLDAKDYVNYDFTNVTFRYNGLGPFGFSHNTVHGKWGFRTNSEPVATTFLLMRGFGATDLPILIGPDRHPVPNVDMGSRRGQ